MVEAGEKHGDARSFADFQAGSQAFQPVGAAPDASADAGDPILMDKVISPFAEPGRILFPSFKYVDE
jgi:hypothetical protein